ncbi:reverse transcriptase domain, reverse transcriptase zinc-binding domain protein [Tanacetum coccineum]
MLIQSDREDVIMWRDRDGVFRPFSVAYAWESIRLRADVVPWYSIIWFCHCIPRHATHLWLVVKQKLKTQDRLQQWDVGPDTNLNLLKCPLCNVVPDSHSHLFFECTYSSQVWSQIRVLIDMNNIDPRIEDVLAFIIPVSKSKSVVSIISRIVLAATTYYLWNERNSRLFKKKIALVDQVVQVICQIIRLKLVSFKFKKVSTKSRLMLDRWKVPSVCVTHDGSDG